MQNLLNDYARHLSDIGRADSTIATYLDVLQRMDRQLPVGLVSACKDELRDWIYDDRHGQASRKLCRAIVVGFFTWATSPAEPRLDFNPAVLLPKVAAPKSHGRAIPEAEHMQILQQASHPYRDWFIIASFTGARCIEIAALDREHITERRTWLQGKGDRPRFVPTHPAVWALAQQLPPGPVAVDARGTRLTRSQVSHRGNYHLQRVLGFPGVHMHRLRRTFGTRAYEATKDLRAVQELLGHTSPATTQIYVDVNESAMELAVAGLAVA